MNMHLSKQTATVPVSFGHLHARPASSDGGKDDNIYRPGSRKPLVDRSCTSKSNERRDEYYIPEMQSTSITLYITLDIGAVSLLFHPNKNKWELKL